MRCRLNKVEKQSQNIFADTCSTRWANCPLFSPAISRIFRLQFGQSMHWIPLLCFHLPSCFPSSFLGWNLIWPKVLSTFFIKTSFYPSGHSQKLVNHIFHWQRFCCRANLKWIWIESFLFLSFILLFIAFFFSLFHPGLNIFIGLCTFCSHFLKIAVLFKSFRALYCVWWYSL